VEVVESGAAILPQRGIGLLEAYVLEAAPLEEYLSALDV
jgi:hypothetical protein